MGIFGLTSYVSQHALECFVNYKLHDCVVLIDGNSAASLIYSMLTKSNHAFGGDYDRYAQSILEFIQLLRKCNVKPIFIFDGGYEVRKLKTVMERIKMNVIICGQYKYKYKESRTFPLLLRDVFKIVLRELDLTIIQCDFEADHELVTLAKILNCPIISSDSDFYISNVQYIPFTRLEFKVCRFNKRYDKGRRYFIPCKLFDEEKFLNRFGGLRDKSVLPILSCVLGNDYFPQNTFNNFLGMNYMVNFDTRIKTIVKWLTTVTCAEDAVQQLIQTVRRNRYDVKKKIMQLINEFNRTTSELVVNIPNVYAVDTALKNEMDKISIDNSSRVNECGDYEISIIENNVNNTVPIICDTVDDSNCFNREIVDDDVIILDEEKYELDLDSNNEGSISENAPSQQNDENSDKESDEIHIAEIPNWVRDKLRQGNENGIQNVHCHARCRSMYVGVYKISPVIEIPTIGPPPSLKTVPDLSPESRANVLIGGLQISKTVNLSLFPEEWKLYVIALIYWKQNCIKCAISGSHIRSLFVCLIYLSIIDRKIGFARTVGDLKNLCKSSRKDKEQSFGTAEQELLNVEALNFKVDVKSSLPKCTTVDELLGTVLEKDCFRAADVFLKYHHVDPNLLKHRKQFNIKLVHAFAQLQHCLQSIMLLNSILNFPFVQYHPHLLFSGTFLYNFYSELHDRKLADGFITKNLLSKSKSLISVYQYLIDSFELCIGVKLERSPKEKKKSRRKKNRTGQKKNDEVENDEISDERYEDPDNIFSILCSME